MNLNNYAEVAGRANDHWWRDPRTNERVGRNMGEMLMLIVSEIAEAMEADRKNLNDDKLPHRNGVEVEFADALIRIFDISYHMGYDLEGAFHEKMAYNAKRWDHSNESRLSAHGKKY